MTHRASLLKKAEKGGEIVIWKRGRPIARLLPVQVPKKRNDDIYEKILAFRDKIVLPKGETTKDLVNAGRRI